MRLDPMLLGQHACSTLSWVAAYVCAHDVEGLLLMEVSPQT